MLRICSLFGLVLFLGCTASDPLVGRATVTDGDSLRIGDERIRLFGIDAPELSQRCTDKSGKTWACGRWSKAQMTALVQGETIRCTAQDRDRYGRVVATCFADGIDLSRVMVDRGAAFAYRRYSRAYVANERRAATAGRGVWQGEADRPSDIRAAARQAN